MLTAAVVATLNATGVALPASPAPADPTQMVTATTLIGIGYVGTLVGVSALHAGGSLADGSARHAVELASGTAFALGIGLSGMVRYVGLRLAPTRRCYFWEKLTIYQREREDFKVDLNLNLVYM